MKMLMRRLLEMPSWLEMMALAGLAILCMTPIGAAFAAATATDTTVTAQGPYQLVEPYLLTLFGAIITAGIGWAAVKFHQLTGINIQDSDRAAIQNAAMNAAGRILAGMEGPVANIKFDVKSPEVKAETDRVLWMMKDEADRLKLTPEKVSTLITGKLGIAQQGASPAGQSSGA